MCKPFSLDQVIIPVGRPERWLHAASFTVDSKPDEQIIVTVERPSRWFDEKDDSIGESDSLDETASPLDDRRPEGSYWNTEEKQNLLQDDQVLLTIGRPDSWHHQQRPVVLAHTSITVETNGVTRTIPATISIPKAALKAERNYRRRYLGLHDDFIGGRTSPRSRKQPIRIAGYNH